MCHSGAICSGLFRCLLTIWIRGGTKSVRQRDHVIWSDQFRHFKPRGTVWVVWVQFDPSQPVPQPLHALGISWHINWRKKATALWKNMCSFDVLAHYSAMLGYASIWKICAKDSHHEGADKNSTECQFHSRDSQLNSASSASARVEAHDTVKKRRKMLISKTLRSLISHDISWYLMISHDISWYLMISHDFKVLNGERSCCEKN